MQISIIESRGNFLRMLDLSDFKNDFSSEREKRIRLHGPFIVARTGIEPATQGFSVLCSTS
jgi:hypothetical protein